MAKTSTQNGGSADIDFEATLWKAADALRSNMDAAEYQHVVLGLIFLKYISDAFDEKHAALEAEKAGGADPEDPDEHRAENLFWVPAEARWSKLKAAAKQPEIGKTADDATIAIERDNPTLKGVLPEDHAHPRFDEQRLGQLIDLVGNIGLGDKANRSRDVLGRVYECFLSGFASAEGKGGGDFYTPRSNDWLIVSMVGPLRGRVYDPCVGAGCTLVLCHEYVLARGGKASDLALYAQELHPTTWRLCNSTSSEPLSATWDHITPTHFTMICTEIFNSTTSSLARRSLSPIGGAIY